MTYSRTGSAKPHATTWCSSRSNTGFPHGCIVYSETIAHDGTRTLIIERADPTALVLDEILHEVLERPRSTLRSSVLRLQGAPDTGWCDGSPGVCQYPSHPFCFTGWLLHLDLPGGHLVYRIGKYRPEHNCWEASWPD